jgi:hypothetical protein
MSPDQEILPPAITDRDVAEKLIKVANSHFREARRATILVMADLRRLQDGQVHILYGYSNFAKWAEWYLPGLKAGNVRQLTRAGAVALELDKRNLIDLENPKGVGTTGLRELSVIGSTYGDDKMAEVFVTARAMLTDTSEVTNETVQAAMRVLMPPPKLAAIEKIEEGEREVEAEDDEPETEYSAKVTELIDQIRDLSYDLPETLQDVILASEALARQLASEKVHKDQQWIEGTQ